MKSYLLAVTLIAFVSLGDAQSTNIQGSQDGEIYTYPPKFKRNYDDDEQPATILKKDDYELDDDSEQYFDAPEAFEDADSSEQASASMNEPEEDPDSLEENKEYSLIQLKEAYFNTKKQYEVDCNTFRARWWNNIKYCRSLKKQMRSIQKKYLKATQARYYFIKKMLIKLGLYNPIPDQ